MLCGSHFSPAGFPNCTEQQINAYFAWAREMGGPIVLTEQWSEPFSDLFIRQVQNGAKMAGLPFHLYFSPLRQDDRSKADYPGGLSFAGSACRAAYLARICELAAIKPDLLGLATEVNLCRPDNDQYRNLRTLLIDARMKVDAECPEVTTTVSLQYDVMRRSGDFSAVDEGFGLCDMFTFTTYPWAFSDPPARDYYASLLAIFPKPFGISELGISSAGVCGEWKQLRRYREARVGLRDAGCEFVTLMQMCDLPPMHDNPQLTALGVRRADGTPKAAWRLWQ